MYAEAISNYLAQNGIKQKYLVERTGMSSAAVSTFLNGNRGLSVDEYTQICDALDVDLNFFRQYIKARKSET